MRWTWLGCAAVLGASIFQSGPSLGADLFASGKQARELCASSNEWCVGFVTGALDGWSALEAYYDGERFCIPDELTAAQVVELLVQQMEQQPDRLEEPASYLLFEKMIERYPCETGSPG